MKQRLNITISGHLLQQTKKYAIVHNTSVSQLVEEYFERLTRPSKTKTVLEVIRNLPKPKSKNTGDLSKKYYEDNKKKYGF